MERKEELELIVNGEKRRLKAETVLDVIRHFGLEGKLVVAEVDGSIVPREEWGETPIFGGMKIELVHFVGGG